jgi:hypothetical protein
VEGLALFLLDHGQVHARNFVSSRRMRMVLPNHSHQTIGE